MKEIKLTKGYVTIVNDEDFERLNQYKWWFSEVKKGYIYPQTKINHKNIYMHRLIMNFPTVLFIDHINGNTLDNRRENLRLATRSQNGQNSKSPLRKNSTSVYKGVKNHKSKWEAGINYRNKYRYIGIFNTEHQAALAYDLWAKYLFGEFARLNFN